MHTFEQPKQEEHGMEYDGHLFLASASAREIDKCTSKDTNGKPYFTTEGFQNSFAGFEQWMIVLAKEIHKSTGDQRKTQVRVLADAFKSFVRLDLTLANRLHKDDKKYSRLNPADYEVAAPVDQGAFTVSQRQQHLRSLVLNVGQAYGRDWSALFVPVLAGQQQEFEKGVTTFQTELDAVIASDEGLKALQIIDGSTQKGIQEPNAPDGLYRIADSGTVDAEYKYRLKAPEKDVIYKTTKDWKILRKAYELNAMKLELDDAFTGENLLKVWERMQENRSDFELYLKAKPEFENLTRINLASNYKQAPLQNKVLAEFLKWEKLTTI